jgi:hypothetical protein
MATENHQPASALEISPLAAEILAKGNSYWAPRASDIRLETIEFAEPSFLAGPFEGRYGLVYIAHSPDALPLQEELDATEAKVLTGRSTTYLPYSARQRLAAKYPAGMEFHWDPVAKESYSDLDLPFVTEEVRARLEFDGTRCSTFASTDEGRKILFAEVTDAEHVEHQKALKDAVRRIQDEMQVVNRCAERPYSVRLQGNDDSSWTVSCANLESVEILLQALRQRGYAAVADLMYFTN